MASDCDAAVVRSDPDCGTTRDASGDDAGHGFDQTARFALAAPGIQSFTERGRSRAAHYALDWSPSAQSDRIGWLCARVGAAPLGCFSSLSFTRPIWRDV